MRRYVVEQEIAALAGVRYALGLSGGGSGGLWISLLGLGIGPGDEVIVPGFTFVASISAIVYARATPVLAEVDDSFNLDPADVEGKDHASDAGDHRGPHARGAGAA